MADFEIMIPQMDDLDNLLRKVELLDKRLSTEYPDLFTDGIAADSDSELSYSEPKEDSFFVQLDNEENSTVQQQDSNQDDELHYSFDENNIQAYLLRKRFSSCASVKEWDDAVLTISTISRELPDLSAMTDEELFLNAIDKTVSSVTSDAKIAMAMLERRNLHSAIGVFLPFYTALGNDTSWEKINSLCKRQIVISDQTENQLITLLKEMIGSGISIITEAEALQNAGYRNKQEALNAAANRLKGKISRLQKHI